MQVNVLKSVTRMIKRGGGMLVQTMAWANKIQQNYMDSQRRIHYFLQSLVLFCSLPPIFLEELQLCYSKLN